MSSKDVGEAVPLDTDNSFPPNTEDTHGNCGAPCGVCPAFGIRAWLRRLICNLYVHTQKYAPDVGCGGPVVGDSHRMYVTDLELGSSYHCARTFFLF